MKIQEIQIKGLFGKKDIRWKLNPQVNVLVGVNGSGKSTILSILKDILSIQVNNRNINLFNNAKLSFENKSETQYIPTQEILRIKHHIQDEKVDPNTNLVGLSSSLPLLFLGVNPILSIAVGVFAKAVATGYISAVNDKNIKSYSTEEEIISKAICGTNNKDNLYIDLIEVHLTNSNANHIIQKSNQQFSNVLDMEISNTIHEFNKIADSELIDRLSSSLNVFFNQIDKHVSYENNELIYTDTQLQTTLNYSNLSSGERQLIYILLRVALSNGDKSKTAIILMDEPEISLHLDWQEHFIKQLTILNPDAQFIIVTHSPALIMNGWNDVYVDMEEITTWL